MEHLIRNKKAYQKYEIVDKYEAGIVLHGHEVKSVRTHQGSLDGAYISLHDGQAYLKGAHIPPYQPANTPKTYDPYRERKLLLQKREIRKLQEETRKARLTVVPLSMYNKGNTVKVSVALVRGKKKHDKREDIKKRDVERDLKRSLKKNIQF